MSRNLIWSSSGESVRDGEKLSPLLKWHWGKRGELEHILPNIPESFTSYFEPFVWWGAVYTAIQAEKYYINDKSHELIDLYRIITSENRESFFAALEQIDTIWNTLWNISEENSGFFVDLYQNFAENSISKEILIREIDTFIERYRQDFSLLFWARFSHSIEFLLQEMRKNFVRKFSSIKEREEEWGIFTQADIIKNSETALKSAAYMYFRFLYNRHKEHWLDATLYTAIFLFIRNFAYGWMFRYKRNGDFNIPYGWISYNRRKFKERVKHLAFPEFSSQLQKTHICNTDFEDFLEEYPPTPEDFVFLDPPYDSDFSEYAGNAFWSSDQERLAEYLLEKCKAKWMMIIWKTALISELYSSPEVHISTFEKQYLANMRNRNVRKVEHLLITNYPQNSSTNIAL